MSEKETIERLKLLYGERYLPTSDTDGMVLDDSLCKGCSKRDYEKDIRCNTWDMTYHDYVDAIIKYQDRIICLIHSNFDIKEFMK